jgi:hypothetical protein
MFPTDHRVVFVSEKTCPWLWTSLWPSCKYQIPSLRKLCHKECDLWKLRLLQPEFVHKESFQQISNCWEVATFLKVVTKWWSCRWIHRSWKTQFLHSISHMANILCKKFLWAGLMFLVNFCGNFRQLYEIFDHLIMPYIQRNCNSVWRCFSKCNLTRTQHSEVATLKMTTATP